MLIVKGGQRILARGDGARNAPENFPPSSQKLAPNLPNANPNAGANFSAEKWPGVVIF